MLPSPSDQATGTASAGSFSCSRENAVPLFFFHIRRQDDFEADVEGMTFDTLNDALSDATDSLREIVAEELRAGRPIDIVGIEIADTKGEVIKVVTVEDAVLKPLSGTTSTYDHPVNRDTEDANDFGEFPSAEGLVQAFAQERGRP
jgi:hypothetical protein